MTNAIMQMAAMSAALRMLLAGDPLTKPDDLLICASNELTEQLIKDMVANAANGRTTFLTLFYIEDDTARLDKVMVVDGSTEKNQINVGGGKLVEKANGSFAILSLNRDKPYEYAFGRNGHRLERRSVADVTDRAMMELRGLQALLAMAETAACVAEAQSASVSHC
ncbi:hypothetical protein [Sphingomonas sp. RB1R13]|uniref:hypothetical protein n=1 Tax=Sphingomonas sp. RB1R13 TaxID=3096159 RepID=UPI002FC5B264